MPAPVRVRFYATARVAAGMPRTDVPVPPGGIVARELVALLAREYPKLGGVLRSSRFLRNDRYLEDLDETVAPGDRFAVHPPYGGG